MLQVNQGLGLGERGGLSVGGWHAGAIDGIGQVTDN